MDTIIRFHEGLKGSGVVVSVCYGLDRIIFDFGAPFRPETEVYDGVVMARKNGYVKDAIRLKKVPAIDGIFDKSEIAGMNIISYQESDFNSAVFISHLHLDHMSNIGMVHPNIPVYMSNEAYKLQKCLDEVGEKIGERDFCGLELYEQVKVGTISVTPYFSDHPCFGSVGYLIETPDTTIYYSGDIRFHGLQKERAWDEITKLTQKSIDLLIIDGTSYSPKKFIRDLNNDEELIKPSKDIMVGGFLEAKIYDDVCEHLINSNTLGVFNIYHRDMQLINALIQSAKKCNREIVFEPETAYIIYKLLNKRVRVYYPDTKCYSENKAYLSVVRSELLEIDAQTINLCPGKYFIQNTYKHLMSLMDFNCQGGNYFHLFGAPFVKGERAYGILEKMLERYKLKHFAYANLFSFNHAFPNHLSYMIELIAAKSVVAVHSNTPEKLNSMNSKHYLPKQNTDYIIKDGYLDEISQN